MWGMLDMAKKAISKTQSLSRGANDADENLRLALTHLIQIIGEAGRQVTPARSTKTWSRVRPTRSCWNAHARVYSAERPRTTCGEATPSVTRLESAPFVFGCLAKLRRSPALHRSMVIKPRW